MSGAHRRGDKGGKADSPSKATGGSPNVSINGLPAMREGDVYEDGSRLVKGSRSVTINGRPAGRIGDATDSGGVALTGSSNVFIGDISPQEFTSSCAQAYERALQETQEILTAQPPHIFPEGGIDTNRERNMINRYLRRNRLINQAYRKLYHDMPDNRWAGLAAIVSSQMGCNMWLVAQKYVNPYISTIMPYISYVWFPKWIEALGEGNMAIFEAMYPALRTAADQGYEQFLKCYKADAFGEEIPEAIANAIKALQLGKIKDAAEFLIEYEQSETIYLSFALTLAIPFCTACYLLSFIAT